MVWYGHLQSPFCVFSPWHIIILVLNKIVAHFNYIVHACFDIYDIAWNDY